MDTPLIQLNPAATTTYIDQAITGTSLELTWQDPIAGDGGATISLAGDRIDAVCVKLLANLPAGTIAAPFPGQNGTDTPTSYGPPGVVHCPASTANAFFQDLDNVGLTGEI